MKFERKLQLLPLLHKNSFFLFGPRATGKTTLIKKQLGDQAQIIDLLKSSLYLRLQENPSLLEELISEKPLHAQFVVIDEIQKLPILMNEVHRLIEDKDIRFLLSGSSARKLKKAGANLLAGRAWRAELFGLTSQEIGTDFDLEKLFLYGTLPRVWNSENPTEELEAYVDTYLKEEILQEGLVRQLRPFSGFLKHAALYSGELLNYESISKEIGVSAPTVKEYYSILIDTLLAFELEPIQSTGAKKPVSTSKIYLFDLGVTNQLAEIKSIDRASDIYGKRFEQFIATELRAYLSYHRIKESLGFWRVHQGKEVDFVIGKKCAIEVKSAKKISSSDLNGLKAFREEKWTENFYLISNDPLDRQTEGVHCLYWKTFLNRLWSGKII